MNEVEQTNIQLYSKEKNLIEQLPVAEANEHYFEEEDEDQFSEGLAQETGSGLSYENAGRVDQLIESNRNVVKAFYEANKDRLHEAAIQEDAERSE